MPLQLLQEDDVAQLLLSSGLIRPHDRDEISGGLL